jgi:hypothetical protein
MITKQFIIRSNNLITLGSDTEKICGRVPRNQDILSCVVNRSDYDDTIYCILILWESSSQKRYNQSNL